MSEQKQNNILLSILGEKKLSAILQEQENAYGFEHVQKLNNALKNYNNSGTLKIALFTENERYFIHQFIPLEGINASAIHPQTFVDESTKYISQIASRRSNYFITSLENLKVCDTNILKNTDLDEIKQKLINSFKSPEQLHSCLFDIDNVTLDLEENVAKILKKNYATVEGGFPSFKEALNDPNYYDPTDGTFGFDFLSKSEIAFIEGFKNFLDKNHSSFTNLALEVTKKHRTEIANTKLEIEPLISLTFLGKLFLNQLEAAKLRAYYSKQIAITFDPSPLSQPIPNQQTTTDTNCQYTAATNTNTFDI